MNKQNPEFKKLQQKWYDKLAKSGFDDIESEGQIVVWSSEFAKKRTLRRFESQKEYYRLASIFLNEYTFETAADRFFWEHHADGKTIREIESLSKKRKYKFSSRAHVERRIQAISKLMLEKYKVGTQI